MNTILRERAQFSHGRAVGAGIGKEALRDIAEGRVQTNEIATTWGLIQLAAFQIMQDEPFLGGMIREEVMSKESFEEFLSDRIAGQLAGPAIGQRELSDLCAEVLAKNTYVTLAACADVHFAMECDAACEHALQPLLFFKGYLALQCHRIAHELWTGGRKDLARYIQAQTSKAFGVDIHPGASIGKEVLLDHANSIVVGQTAVVGNRVTVLHSVTLGSTGSEGGDRHPKIGNNVLLGAGAIVLGNIRVGDHAKVAAGSVVVNEVPPRVTVAGVPAQVVSEQEAEQ